MKLNKKSGFTLLEIIVVIIIVGVLASLAMPRFFSTIEYSRSTEALSNIGQVRKSIERCAFARNGTYVGCTMNQLDLQDPAGSPGSHFTYAISNLGAATFRVTATRNALNGGDGSSTIQLDFNGTAYTRSGTGVFAAIN